MAHEPQQPGSPDIPEALRQDLTALFGASVPVPAQVDRAVLGMARRRRWYWGWVAGAAVAAAAALTTAGVWWAAYGPARPVEPGPAVALHEYHRTGDIRDAFYLARQLKAGRQPAARWDVNGDGRIDQADVDALALAAVSLKQGAVQ